MAVQVTAALAVKDLMERESLPGRIQIWPGVAEELVGTKAHYVRAGVFEASSTWLSFLLDECDKYYKLYRNERQLPALSRLPSETFHMHCVTGFEGDEAPPSKLPEFYENILAWSSDVYHHDGDDAWRALDIGSTLTESGGRPRKKHLNTRGE